MAKRIPAVVLHFRIDQMSEILFAGFEAELYSQEEMPFLYWYLSRILLAKQLSVLDALAKELPLASHIPYGEFTGSLTMLNRVSFRSPICVQDPARLITLRPKL